MTNVYCIRPKGLNVGNEAIHVALRHQLNRAFGEPVNIINVPATSRYESHAKAGFTAATVHEMNQYADGVIVGGGNLYENGELDVDLNALRALEAPLMLYSLSMGRIANRRGELVRRTDSMSDAVIAALHERADLSLARDLATVDHLAEAGATAQLGGCPTLFVDEAPQHVIPEAAVADGVVLVSVRTPDLMSVPLQRRIRVRDEVERILELARETTGAQVKLLCHDHRDIPFAATFAGIEYLYTDDVYLYLSLLRNARLCIAYRLHAVLPCLAFGTPVIKVSYDERGNSMMDTIGMDAWNIDMLVVDDVVAEVRRRTEHLDELDSLRDAAAPRWAELQAAQERAMNEFAELVQRHRRRDVDAGALVSGS
jgi:polysaccharide pyruvyl transferase WcaK-like protein